MNKDKEFALLVGKAFLRELAEGDTESAVAFGRAFLLALGMKGPEPANSRVPSRGRHHSEQLAMVVN